MMDTATHTIARGVILKEMQALQQTLACVESAEFAQVVDLIAAATYCNGTCCNTTNKTNKNAQPPSIRGGGRLVFVGLGKSGNVAAKVAATCSSLGIHSFFLHTTEAAHGGLGCISSNDVVLMMSNSGKTPEMLALSNSLSLLGCKIVLISGSRTSPLSDIADYTLCYGEMDEADQLGLAPTCSTVAAMGIGDALAISVSSSRGFSKWDFGKRHPGGALGDAVMGSTFAHLAEYDQHHLLDHFLTLSPSEITILQHDVQEIDVARLKDLSQEAVIPKKVEALQPFPHVVDSSKLAFDEKIAFYEQGLEQIANGRVATVVLAGGQATRAGITYPKGLLDVNLPSHKSLFEIQVQSTLKLQELAAQHYNRDVPQIPVYVMVGKEQHSTIHQFFESNAFFGLNPNNLVLFDQCTMPCLSFDGKLLLENKCKVARAPDGHGGLYEAMNKGKVVEDMKARNIEHIFVYSVDNLLVKIADPIFIGYCASKDCDFGYKVVKKAYPSEPAGVVCLVEGQADYVEYNELPVEAANMRTEEGELLYNAANILNLYYKVSFMENVTTNYNKLSYHVAKKKVPYLNPAGDIVMPEKPNAYKFEKFIPDCTRMARKIEVLMVDRESQFSPIKNAWGEPTDSPDTARIMLSERHKQYIIDAGGIVEGDASVDMCEIMPHVSYAGEGLEFVKGGTFTLPLLLGAIASRPDLSLSRS